jgi:hypothetical protein
MKANQLKKLAVATAGVVLSLSVAPMPSIAVVFNLNGRFNDGGTFNGSFDYDNQTQNLASWNIITTEGSQFPGTTYTSSNSNSFSQVLPTPSDPLNPSDNVEVRFVNNLVNFATAPVGALYEQDFEIIFPMQSLNNFVGGLIRPGYGYEAWFTKTEPGTGIGPVRVPVTGAAQICK